MSQPSLKRNFVLNAIRAASAMLFPLITFQYASRVLLAEGMGRVAFATSFVAYFNMFARLGVPSYGLRACAQARDDRTRLTRTAQELLLINLLAGVVAFAALGVCLFAVPRVRADRGLFLIVSTTLFFDAIGMEWLYQGLEQYAYITYRSLAFKAVALVSVFLMLHRPEDYLVYGAISVFAGAAPNVLNFFHARRYISLRPVGGYHLSRHMQSVLVFFAMSCAITVYTNMDEVMLGFMRGNADVGYYNVAVKIKTALVGIVAALSAVLMPRASYYIDQGRLDAFRGLTRKGLHFVLSAGLALTVYFIMFSREAIGLLFGAAYEASVLPMQLIMPAVLLTGITRVMGNQILIPLGKEKTLLHSVAAGAAANLVINALLIPGLGAVGAVLGTIAAETAVLIWQFVKVKQSVDGVAGAFFQPKAIVAVALAAGAAVWVKFLPMGDFARLAVSAVCFFGVFAAALLAMKDELAWESWGYVAGILKRGKH